MTTKIKPATVQKLKDAKANLDHATTQLSLASAVWSATVGYALEDIAEDGTETQELVLQAIERHKEVQKCLNQVSMWQVEVQALTLELSGCDMSARVTQPSAKEVAESMERAGSE